MVYAIALTVGTHWPRLELPQTVPATDKTIHLIAFGGLTILLWQTRWVRTLWIVALITIGWAGADELTQGLPGLNRTVSRHDFIADMLGVLVAASWIWALRTRGVPGGMNRLRMAQFNHIVEEMFADRRAWTAGVVGMLATGIPLLLYLIAFRPDANAGRVAISIAVVACAVITYLGWMRLWHDKSNNALRIKPCLQCGATLSGATPTVKDSVTCRTCHTSHSILIWEPAAEPPARIIVRMALRPALVALAVLSGGFAMIFITSILHAYFIGQGGFGARLAPRVASMFGTLPNQVWRVIDLAAHLVLFAVVTRIYRASLARFHDRASICMRCGHDLRATPVHANGIGRCGECGTTFARLVTDPANTEHAQVTE